jgi:hypothetical protein
LLQTGEILKWSVEEGATKVALPASIQKAKTNYPALAFSFETDAK